VFRTETTRNLLFDINLLTSEFQKVLGDAVERALRMPKGAAVFGHLSGMDSVEESAIVGSPQ
jgi:hypothetical protein